MLDTSGRLRQKELLKTLNNFCNPVFGLFSRKQAKNRITNPGSGAIHN